MSDVEEESGIVEIGAPGDDYFDDEDRRLSKPITGGEEVYVDQQEEPIGRLPEQPKRGKVTSVREAKALQAKKRELLRVQPAYDHIETLIDKAVINGGEDSVLIDLMKYMLTDEDLGKIKDSYASEGWRIEVGAEPFALTFSFPS